MLKTEDIPDQHLLALYRLWLLKKGERRFPARRDFDVFEFKPWFNHLLIIDVVHKPFDLRCRLIGTATTEALGLELTGRSLLEVAQTPAVSGSPEDMLRDFVQCAETGSAVFGQDRVPFRSKDMLQFRRLLLPLSTVAADRVEQILGGIYYQLSPSDGFVYRW